jgi:hypothetical protein
MECSELEEIAKSLGQTLATRRTGSILQSNSRLMEQLGHDPLRERIKCFELALVEIAESGAKSVEFSDANVFGLFMKARHERSNFACGANREIPLEFFYTHGLD